MIRFRNFQLIFLTLACLLEALSCSPMMFLQQQEQQQLQQQQQKPIGMPQFPPEQSQTLVTPILTNPGNEDDSYIVLSDDEVLQNADMLRHLSLATKEEVEEIVEGNPAIQEALLKKIKKVIKLREEANHLLADGKAIKQYHKHIHKQEPVVIDNIKHNNHFEGDKEVYVEELDDIDDLEQQLAAERIRLIKMKLKSNSAKLFKIGSTIRRRIDEMRRRKAEKHDKIPKFHLNVSTSNHKQKEKDKEKTTAVNEMED